MKIFKLMAIALVAMVGLNSCSKDCECEFIEVNHSKDLVGTWTCFQEGYAEALVINADGSVLSTGVENGEYWEGVKGNIKTVNNKMTLTFEDNDNFDGRFEMLCGEAFTIFEEDGKSFTYRYCANDFSDEIVGMWVCMQEAFGQEEEMVIQTFDKNGRCLFTGYVPDANGYIKEAECNYKVIGDLLITSILDGNNNPVSSVAIKIDITPNAIEYGDIMATYNPVLNTNSTFLRIKQYLELPGMKYDYIKTFVTNVKGEDKDIDFMGYTFNFAKMDGSGLDKMLKALLFAVEFPDADHLNYSYQMNGNKETYKADIEVEGNTMTIKMSEKVATLKDVVLYAFQDADCSQMHFYMHKTAFVNFYTNMQAMLMEATDEQFDINNAEAVNAIYNEINNAVETINVSLVMSK